MDTEALEMEDHFSDQVWDKNFVFLIKLYLFNFENYTEIGVIIPKY